MLCWYVPPQACITKERTIGPPPRERVKRLVYRKFGISEMDISEIDTFDDLISDMSISDISIAKIGHIGLDISEI
jgi:hypothetical protein